MDMKRFMEMAKKYDLEFTDSPMTDDEFKFFTDTSKIGTEKDKVFELLKGFTKEKMDEFVEKVVVIGGFSDFGKLDIIDKIFKEFFKTELSLKLAIEEEMLESMLKISNNFATLDDVNKFMYTGTTTYEPFESKFIFKPELPDAVQYGKYSLDYNHRKRYIPKNINYKNYILASCE